MGPVNSPAVDRRTVLASLGAAGSAALAGCRVCANTYRVYDDLLRVDLTGFHEAGEGYRGEAAVRHRGPNNWDWGARERETFFTNYQDVTFQAYAHDGRLLVEVPMGEFEPGTTERRPIETDEVPMVVTAVPGGVTYDRECLHADVGGQLAVYAGHYESLDPFDVDEPQFEDPRETVETHLERSGTGHRWIPYSELRESEDPPPADEFRRAKCTQRRLAGRELDGPADFSAMEAATGWLERRETVAFQVYPRSGARVGGNREPAVDVPDRIAEVIRETDWQERDRPMSVTESVSLEEYKRLVGILAGEEGPTMPPCEDYGACTDSYEYGSRRGLCRRGVVYAYFEFDPDPITEGIEIEGGQDKLYWTDESLVIMKYEWEGLPAESQ